MVGGGSGTHDGRNTKQKASFQRKRDVLSAVGGGSVDQQEAGFCAQNQIGRRPQAELLLQKMQSANRNSRSVVAILEHLRR